MRLLKYVSLVTFSVTLIGIFLRNLGFESIGSKLFVGGWLFIGLIIGVTLVFSVRTYD